MSKPQIIELPDRQGVIPVAGQVILGLHDSGRYLWPFRTKETFPADFFCPYCGVLVRWATAKSTITILSCHCLIAICGAPKSDLIVDANLWAQWIFDCWAQEYEGSRSQAN